MPKKVMDYSKCVIYKIVCKDLTVTDCYVGHTTNFTQRKKGHKNACNCETNKNHNLKVYQTIRANGGWEEWSMIEIEKFPCKDFNEATARERYWYEQLNSKLNMLVPNRSQKEYYQTHKTQILKYRKEWHKAHEEYLKEYRTNHRKENIEIYTIKNKNYKLLNKEKLKMKQRQLFNCECGGKCLWGLKARHFRTQKHQDFISSNSNNAETTTQTEEAINV